MRHNSPPQKNYLLHDSLCVPLASKSDCVIDHEPEFWNNFLSFRYQNFIDEVHTKFGTIIL